MSHDVLEQSSSSDVAGRYVRVCFLFRLTILSELTPFVVQFWLGWSIVHVTLWKALLMMILTGASSGGYGIMYSGSVSITVLSRVLFGGSVTVFLCLHDGILRLGSPDPSFPQLLSLKW